MKVLKSVFASFTFTTLLLASSVALADEFDSTENAGAVSIVRATPADTTPSANTPDTPAASNASSAADKEPGNQGEGAVETERPCVITHASETLETVTIGNVTYKDDGYGDLDYKGGDAVSKTHSSFLYGAEGKVLNSRDLLKFLAIFGKDTVIDTSVFHGRQPVTIKYSFSSTCTYSPVKEEETPGKAGSWMHVYNFTVEFPSATPTPEASSAQPAVSADNAGASPFPVPTSTTDSALRNAPALAPIANDVEDDEADSESDTVEEEAPNLPVTGVQKTTGGGTKDVANAATVTGDAVTGASSRAGLFALIACAAFACVAAVSVFTMRNFKR